MQSLGKALREMRIGRGWTQDRLAAQALVTARSVRYWETDRQQPRQFELDNVLNALEATSSERALVIRLLTDQRAVRLMQGIEVEQNRSTSLFGPLPGIGNLILAMRMRCGWTQEQFAAELRVSRSTIIRWEATQTLPSAEDINRICLLLNAYPEEETALRARCLQPLTWPVHLTMEECQHQFALLLELRNGNTGLMPLTDLHILALKREIRLLVGLSSEAVRLLANLEIHHSWWLFMQGRTGEACAGNWRALNMMRGAFAPDDFWLRALNLLSAHAGTSAQGPMRSVRLLNPWLRLLPVHLRFALLCDMALYAGQAQRHEEAASLLQRAELGLMGNSPRRADRSGTHWHLHHFRLTRARVLLYNNRPVEALNGLPTPTLKGDGRIHELLIRAEICMAANEQSLVSQYLSEATVILASMPLPKRQRKFDQLLAQANGFR